MRVERFVAKFITHVSIATPTVRLSSIPTRRHQYRASSILDNGRDADLPAPTRADYRPYTPSRAPVIFTPTRAPLSTRCLGELESRPIKAGRTYDMVGDRLNDKTAVITGGAGGIGAAAGELFVRQGANVLLVDRDLDALSSVEQAIDSDRVASVAADVTSEADTRSYVQAAIDRFGAIDVLIANAGIEGDVSPIADYPVDTFDNVLAVNVRGVWLGIKYAMPHLQTGNGGSVVITSSTAGVKGTPGISPYTASKHAVIGMMKSLALECAPLGVRVNTVNPCPVETRMMRSLEAQLQPGDSEAARARIARSIPIGRYADPIDIAQVMLFLASDDAKFVTGSVYMADGGYTA